MLFYLYLICDSKYMLKVLLFPYFVRLIYSYQMVYTSLKPFHVRKVFSNNSSLCEPRNPQTGSAGLQGVNIIVFDQGWDFKPP